MNGTLVQLIALASTANGAIAGKYPLDGSAAEPEAFKYCNSIQFVDIKPDASGKLLEVLRCETPLEWLRSVVDRNFKAAWLHNPRSTAAPAPNHVMAAFAGSGGQWCLLVSGPNGTERWDSRWQVTAPKRRDRRIWSATYYCSPYSDESVEPPAIDLEAASTRLAKALAEIHDFALKHRHKSWAKTFRTGLDYLTIAGPVNRHKSWAESFRTGLDYLTRAGSVKKTGVSSLCLPYQASYPPQAQRLLDATGASWVFGGMGTWNDLFFELPEDEAIYGNVTAELYAAIMNAIEAAACSFK